MLVLNIKETKLPHPSEDDEVAALLKWAAAAGTFTNSGNSKN